MNVISDKSFNLKGKNLRNNVRIGRFGLSYCGISVVSDVQVIQHITPKHPGQGTLLNVRVIFTICKVVAAR